MHKKFSYIQVHTCDPELLIEATAESHSVIVKAI